jgi:antitoxin VapB
MIEADSKTFKSGNSEAVRLPKEVALGLNVAVTIRKDGDTLTIRPKQKKTFGDLVEALARLPKPDKPFKRERIIFPKRNWR